MSRSLMMAVTFVFSIGVIQSTSFAEKWSKGGERDYHNKSIEKKLFKKIHLIFLNQDELGVTDEQLEKIKELKTTLKKTVIKKDAEIDVIKVDIESSLHKDKINIEAVNKLIDQKYEAKKSKSKQMVASLAKLKEILSKEQFDKMKNMFHKKMREGSHGRHESMPEGSHGKRKVIPEGSHHK